MNKRTETAKVFLGLVKRTYAEPVTRLVTEATEEEEIVFHKLHNVFKERSSVKVADKLDDCYPFLKVGGEWRLSLPKMHVYLRAAQYAITTFEDESMQLAYKASQNAYRYLEEAKSLDYLLTPKLINGGYDEYQRALVELYQNHMMQQLTLLS